MLAASRLRSRYRSAPQQATVPPIVTPQVWLKLALTETNCSSGGVPWPSAFCPQQVTEWSALTPHACFLPVLMEVKAPPGGVAWPASSAPQHVTDWSALIPQV